MTAKPADSKYAYPALLGDAVPKFLNCVVLLLAFGLIAFISWDTYKGADFLENSAYMAYQFVTCMVFLVEYFYLFALSRHKARFLVLAFPFLFIAIPYLNIVEFLGLDVPRRLLVYLCFIPILRGLFALIMVVTYISRNLTTTVCASYVLVLLPVVYMSGLVFYIAEHAVNPGIRNFWYALWWAGMSVTTIGCYINPVTATGMILGFVLSLLGIVMFPLFTVYFGNLIQNYEKKLKEKQ